MVPSPWALQGRANLLSVRRLGEPHAYVRPALEIDALAQSALMVNGDHAGYKEDAAKTIEILGLAHPVDVGLFEQLNHAESTSLL